jgi:hypothetical protein
MERCPNCGAGELKIIAAILERPVIEKIRPLVVSCGTQQSELMVVVEPGGHVGRSLAGLSTCPRGGSSQRLS